MVGTRISPLKASILFYVATLYFFLLLFTLFPFLKATFSINPALYWFVTGYFLFVPLFTYALLMARAEGNRGTKQIMLALNIKSFTKIEWAYSGSTCTHPSPGLTFGVLNKNDITSNTIPALRKPIPYILMGTTMSAAS